MKYYRIEEIKAANRQAGQYFFEPDTMRFFRSRVHYPSYCGPGGVFFVTSEKYENRYSGTSMPRMFTIRKFDPATGNVDSVSEFQEFKVRSTAHRAAKRLSKLE